MEVSGDSRKVAIRAGSPSAFNRVPAPRSPEPKSFLHVRNVEGCGQSANRTVANRMSPQKSRMDQWSGCGCPGGWSTFVFFALSRLVLCIFRSSNSEARTSFFVVLLKFLRVRCNILSSLIAAQVICLVIAVAIFAVKRSVSRCTTVLTR